VGPRPAVFVVSDSVGETADLVTRAAAAQFAHNANFDIRRFPLVDDPEAVHDVIMAARLQPTLVVYTLILPEVREEMQRLLILAGVPGVDIMGPMMQGFEHLTGTAPTLQAGLVHQLDEDYFKRVEAVEFAVKYDDGKDPRGVIKADVVLLGVSRSSKTPVSMYLANRKVKVCNIPLVPEVPLPPELFRAQHKLVGLRVSPDKLATIREERVRTMGLSPGASYASLDRIHEELIYAEQCFKRLGCPIVDVTNKAVEETAVRVLELIDRGTTA